MFPQQPQQQFRGTNADVQMFYGQKSDPNYTQYSWIKPIGVSHVYMMLIGAGGGGINGTASGNSGNVTVWYGAAQNVPDELIVSPGYAGTSYGGNTTIQFKGSSTKTLLTAHGGYIGGTGNPSDPAGVFGSSGFYQNVQGQAGDSDTGSPTTFLCGGGTGTGGLAANYGYGFVSGPGFNVDGFLMLQPIIVGVPTGAINRGTGTTQAGVGCGGAWFNGRGGPGMVLIASW